MKLPSALHAMPVTGVVLTMMLVLFAMPVAAETSEGKHKVAEQDFRANCASCHGWGGAGDGPTADVLKVRPPDLTRIAHRNGGTFPAEAVYTAIEGTEMPKAHGTRQMPVWGLWFIYEAIADSLHTGDTKPPVEKVEKRIRAMIAYLESIQD